MSYVLPLFLGFLTASAGITPPGLINMTAARVEMDEGRTRALVFASGATLVVLIQTAIALFFAQFIDAHPEVVVLLREIGLGIFIGLTVFFFIKGKRYTASDTREIKIHSKKSRFFLGMLLSALNFLPIPFYVFVSVTLASYHYFVFNTPFIVSFVIGSGLGAFFGFYCYIRFFKKLERRTAFILANMNYIIGSMTGLVSLITLYNVAEYYW